MKFHIPIKLPSLPNERMHWRALVRIKHEQQLATHLCMMDKVVPPMPLTITITRVGPRKLDDDNLAASCKFVRDQIARMVGTDDGSPLYEWQYEQRFDKSYGVDVEIEGRK